MKVTPDKCFVGCDACKKVLATDVHAVLLTTPPHFRAMYLQAAVEAGKHVFMEKPAGVDPKRIRSIIKTAELAQQKKLSLVAGTQRRHSRSTRRRFGGFTTARLAQIVAAQAYWNGGDMLGYWKWWDKENRSDVEWQLRSWPWFTWTSGRPYRRAARPQPRRDQLGPPGPSGAVHGHGRPAGPHVGQYL